MLIEEVLKWVLVVGMQHLEKMSRLCIFLLFVRPLHKNQRVAQLVNMPLMVIRQPRKVQYDIRRTGRRFDVALFPTLMISAQALAGSGTCSKT